MHRPSFREIRIENTNSCGYKCQMCPREKLTRQIGYMSLDDFALVLEKIKPFSGGFHLHGFGEALLDRQLVSKVRLLKEKYPQSTSLIYSTLGVRVKEDYFHLLGEAGLTFIAISFYGFEAEGYKKIHGYNGFELAKTNLRYLSQAMKQFPIQGVLNIPGDKMASTSLPIAMNPERATFIEWAKELGFRFMEWKELHNYGDGRSYNEPGQRMCPVIQGNRREILNITWDLKVIPCCFDFNASISFGDLRKQSLDEIFASSEYFNFLLAHKTGNLDSYPVCQNCEKIDSGGS